VLLAVGDLPGMFGVGTSGEGCDVEDLRLPGVQEQLVDAVLATGAPTVLLVCSGCPYAVGRFHGRAAAIVQTFQPGQEGGPAVAGLLSGRTNFRGKLPVQIGSSPGGQPHTYLHAPLGGKQSALSNLDPTPTFPFGHGLSYTTFDIGSLRTDRTNIGCDEEFEVSVEVTNTGDRAGVEVVQLYATDPVAQVARPVRALLASAAVDLAAGERVTAVFRLHAERFAYTDLDSHLVVEPGVIVLEAGRSSKDLPATTEVRLTGPARQLRRREREHVDHRIWRGSPI
jgi:beta-xylosidase